MRVVYADTPLLDDAAMQPLFEARRRGAVLAVLGFEAADPGAYGRLILATGGELEEIVEAKEATAEQLAISLCNSGVLAGDAETLFELLGRVSNANAKGEYYLTDGGGLARARGLRVDAVLTEETRVLGVNSQAELCAAEALWQQGCRAAALAAGVAMPAPDTVGVAPDTGVAGGAVRAPTITSIRSASTRRASRATNGTHQPAPALQASSAQTSG